MKFGFEFWLGMKFRLKVLSGDEMSGNFSTGEITPNPQNFRRLSPTFFTDKGKLEMHLKFWHGNYQ